MKKFFLIATLLLLCVLTTVFSVMGAPVADEDIYAAATQMTANNVLSGGTVEAHCPKCDKTVTWTPLPNGITKNQEYKSGGHFYLDQDVSNKAFYFFYKNACLHLNGHNITSTVRAIYAETGSVLNIMGDGPVTGVGMSNSSCDRGSALDIAGVANLYGGTYKHAGAYPVVTTRGSKGGLNMFTRALGVEVAKYGIRVNCVAPGLIFTKLAERYSKEDVASFSRKIPVGRGGTVEEIVPMIQFLADVEKTRFIVGQVMCVDGGQSCDGSIESMNFKIN